ncbi:MAG: hypothetical protein V1659_04775 [Candidatus Woesearchaeota archaeon]
MKRTLILVLALAMVSVLLLAGCSKQNVTGEAKGPATVQCNDRIDNDRDGYTDFPNDPGCSSKKDKSELNTAIECDDARDNDNDTKIDMQDGGCVNPVDTDETNCGDGVCEYATETPANCPKDCSHPNSCSDTDGGIVREVKGTVSGYRYNISYNYTDFCMNSNAVKEYYCGGNIWYDAQISCLNMSANNTGICVDGACTAQ